MFNAQFDKAKTKTVDFMLIITFKSEEMRALEIKVHQDRRAREMSQ